MEQHQILTTPSLSGRATPALSPPMKTTGTLRSEQPLSRSFHHTLLTFFVSLPIQSRLDLRKTDGGGGGRAAAGALRAADMRGGDAFHDLRRRPGCPPHSAPRSAHRAISLPATRGLRRSPSSADACRLTARNRQRLFLQHPYSATPGGSRRLGG